MDWVWYLFKFEGRINRARFWLAGLIIVCWMIFLVMLLFVPVGYLFGWTQKLQVSLDNVFAVFDPQSYRDVSRSDLGSIIVQAMVLPLVMWVFLATAVKRLHDRDKSGWWIVPFFVVPGLYKQFEDRLPDSYFLLPVALAVFVFMVWGFVEMYFLKGAASANRFGPDPLAENEDARLRSRGLGSHGAAWDQRYEIELTPHRASPMSSMHVKRGHE
jgi:uncharacterized membrane protein YhaH (DUF805 family)